MIYDSVENLETYCNESDPLYQAVQFVLNFDPSQPDGRYEIEGDELFAMVQTVSTRPAEENLFEAHQEHVDVQMVLEGRERQDVALLYDEEIEIVEEYDPEKDVIFFGEPEHFATVVMIPGRFVVYGPGDGHRPCCALDEPREIRKVCVKIKL